MRTRITVLSVVAFATTVCAFGVDASPWSRYPEVVVPQAVIKSETLTLKEQWVLGCGASSEQVIGEIVSVAPGAGGRVLLVDRQLARAWSVGPTGEIIGHVGRKGEGPGDLQGAYRALQLDDGRIGICGGAPAMTSQFGGTGKIVFYDSEGNPAGQIFGAGDPGEMPMSSLRELRYSRGNLLTSSHRLKYTKDGLTRVFELAILELVDGGRSVVASDSSSGELIDGKLHESDLFEPYAYGRCDISTEGRVAFAPARNQWTVVIANPDRTGVVLVRSWQSVPRTSGSKEAALQALGGAEMAVVEKDEPAIGRIRWRPNGRLWVEPFGINPEPGAFACFDEFSPAGQYLRRIQLVVHGNRAKDELKLMEDGRIVLLRGFKKVTDRGDAIDSAEPEVVLLGAIE